MVKDDPEHILLDTVKAAGGELEISIWSQDYQHALDGHPEVNLDRIRNALLDPIRVVKSKHSENACLFYSFELEDENLGKIFFCVVVAVTSDGIGKMVTAYETTFFKSGIVLFDKESQK